jgi:hypothetical protein
MVCPLVKVFKLWGAESCPVCIGDGTLLKEIYFGVEVDMFDSFDCGVQRGLTRVVKVSRKWLLK